MCEMEPEIAQPAQARREDVMWDFMAHRPEILQGRDRYHPASLTATIRRTVESDMLLHASLLLVVTYSSLFFFVVVVVVVLMAYHGLASSLYNNTRS